jgi:SCY1-like protein 2
MQYQVLNVEQFSRFMTVIRKLGDRVEKEHNQFLRDSQRLEDRSALAVNGGSGAPNLGGSVNFESLVGGTVKADTVLDNSRGWDDDVWGSIFTAGTVSSILPSMSTVPYNSPAAIRCSGSSFHRECAGSTTGTVIAIVAEAGSQRFLLLAAIAPTF